MHVVGGKTKRRRKRQEDSGGRKEATRILHLQGGRPTPSSFLLFLPLLLPLPLPPLRLAFLLFPTKVFAFYTPLQCLGVHYIQLGYFSREFSHVNAARARTFARTSTLSSRVYVTVLTHTDCEAEGCEAEKGTCGNLAQKFRSPPRN